MTTSDFITGLWKRCARLFAGPPSAAPPRVADPSINPAAVTSSVEAATDVPNVSNHLYRLLDRLKSAQARGDGRQLASVLQQLSRRDALVRVEVRNAIEQCLNTLAPGMLLGLEARLRRGWEYAHFPATNDVEWLASQKWSSLVWAYLAAHPNGRVRELAVVRLLDGGCTAATLPHVLFRVNDWVPTIRNRAADAVRSELTIENLAGWIPSLPLLEQLQTRSRADHGWILSELQRLFLLPEARHHLEAALRSGSRSAVRFALQGINDLPQAEGTSLLGLVFSNRDPVGRLHAARIIVARGEFPGRAELLQRMRSDSFMPVRREALYATLKDPPATRDAALREALLDHRSSIRLAARFYLRENARQRGEVFDARSYYREAIGTQQGRLLKAAVEGLGECGSAEDARLLDGFTSDNYSPLAAVALRAIASLDRDGRIGWLEQMLTDHREDVAFAAKQALVGTGNAASADRLRGISRQAEWPHSRRFALQLLLSRHPYDAIADAVAGFASGDEVLVGVSVGYTFKSAMEYPHHSPRSDQRAAVESAVASLVVPLPPQLERHVQWFRSR